ncbi:MAG: hypothetical protein XU11_C0007G0026 [Candidatus Dadabacteria bacterium CSP1-2]|jgi:hypothetical protein|nr:MAG: hypothetical protein XU11_C0007G0026 [Candidatus Dadabacteria bacterium CSP1-2]
MAKKGRKKIKDLVDMLEDPDNTTYIGGDYEDIMEQLEKEISATEEGEENQENKEEE